MILATYRCPELLEHQGNPLIEALPPILDAVSTLDAITSLPAYDTEERNHPDHLRLHYLDRLFDVIQAQPEHIRIASLVSRLIRHGYKSRNPLLPAHANLAYQLATRPFEEVRPAPHFARCRTGLYLTGLSGIGKTTIVERILQLYPQTIVHSNYRGQGFTQTQVVWLKLDCPHNGSPRQLCLNFFSALDDALGGTTNYFEENVRRRGGVEVFVPAMYRLAHTYHLGFGFIDEIQHLTSSPQGGETKTLNLLVNFMNGIGVPLGIGGTLESASLFTKTFRNARRVAFGGPVIIDRYAKDDPRWRFLVETLWHYQWTKNRVELTDEIVHALHDASQAVTDIAVAIYAIAQERAIANGTETLSAQTIQSIVTEQLPILQPALDALRRSDKKAYEQFRELMPPAEQWRHAASAMDEPTEYDALLSALSKRQAERLVAVDTNEPKQEEPAQYPSSELPLPDLEAHLIRQAQRES